jgi:hypothetical protein
MNSERTATKTKVKQRTLKKEIYEMKKTAQNIKEELNKDMKSSGNPGNNKSL